MVYNKIYAELGADRHITLDPINYQYDVKQILMITGENVPSYYNVDFCNVGDTATLTIPGSVTAGAQIPDKYLLPGKNVMAYIVIPGTDGDVQTRYDITIPVDERAEREDIDPTEAEQQQIDSLVAALNDGIERTEAAAEAAEESAGQAEAASQAVQDLGVQAESAAEGESASVEKLVDPETGAVTLVFHLPKGADGVSPTVTVTAITGGHRVTITDAEHQQGQSFDVLDGKDGRSVTGVSMGADYKLTFTFSDNTTWTTPTSIRGETGATPRLAIGTVSTLDPGQSATAQITGTPEDPVLNLGIPQGAPGEMTAASMAPVFSASTAYAAGDYVTYNGQLYVFTAAHAAGAWTGTDAEAASIAPTVSQLKTAFDNNFSIAIDMTPTETDGKFVDASNNNISTSDNFALLGPVPVKKGQKATFNARGYSTVTGMICTCNADNTSRQAVVRSVDNTKREYVYNVTEDGYIVLSYVKSDGYELNLTIDYYSYISALNQLDPIYAGPQNVPIVALLNGFIDPTTNRFNASNSFKTSDSIKLFKGQTLNFTATGYRTNVGMINLYDANADSYQSVARSIDSNEQLYTYTAVTDCFVRLCYLAGTTPTAVVVTTQNDFARIVNLETDVAELQTPVDYPQLFDNILCVGDSLTVGASGNGNEILAKNYPHFLEKLTVAETTVKGHGGYSAKQVWDEYISVASDLSSYDCAVIYLGTNGGLTDTVSSDCNASDYTQNADTNTGCYGKIIGKIKADAPNCTIFCVAGPAENIRRNETMNPAVRGLTTFYQVGLLDLENSILSDDGSVGSQKRYTYRPVDAIHYNALGYLTLANLIGDCMHDYIAVNLTRFA